MSILSDWALSASPIVLLPLLLFVVVVVVVVVMFRHIISGLWIGKVPRDLVLVLGPSDAPPPSGGRLSSPLASTPTPGPPFRSAPPPAGAFKVTASPKSARNNRPEGSPRA